MEKKKILFIDDETDLLAIMKMNLERTGKYEVMVLPGADETIVSQVREFGPDVILLDIRMPLLSGDQVCRLLQKNEETRRIPIISLSALDTDKDREMMFNAGAVEHLVKPIERDALIARIEEILSR